MLYVFKNIKKIKRKMENLSLVELKSVAYDIISQMQTLQNSLQQVQQRIIELQNQEE